MRLLRAAVFLLVGVVAAAAQSPEKPRIVLGVGGKALLYYLPLTIAERKGYFTEEGIDVEIQDFAGGARSLQALVSGSVDVVTGAYEHTIRMQTKGHDIRAVVELGRYPAITVGVAQARAYGYRTPADLKGLRIAVTATGSSTHLLVSYLLASAGVDPHEASFIGFGDAASVVAAVKDGRVDAVAHLEPAITTLERDGDIRVIADTRTEEGTRALFGSDHPGAVLYAKRDFIGRHPNAVQGLVTALVRALRWIETASAEEIAATVPGNYLMGDRALYVLAVRNSKPAYSTDGLVSERGMKSVHEMLARFDEEIRTTPVDLARTFEDRFARKAIEARK